MKIKLERFHWERAEQDNINLILECQMKIDMALKVLEMIREKLSKFPVQIKQKTVRTK
jgi:hypothetical protein